VLRCRQVGPCRSEPLSVRLQGIDQLRDIEPKGHRSMAPSAGWRNRRAHAVGHRIPHQTGSEAEIRPPRPDLLDRNPIEETVGLAPTQRPAPEATEPVGLGSMGLPQLGRTVLAVGRAGPRTAELFGSDEAVPLVLLGVAPPGPGWAVSQDQPDGVVLYWAFGVVPIGQRRAASRERPWAFPSRPPALRMKTTMPPRAVVAD
jgi:hypothetical protein